MQLRVENRYRIPREGASESENPMTRPRIPDPLTVVYCIACRKPQNARGWYGPGCMCDVKTGHGAERAHSTVGIVDVNAGSSSR